MVHVGIAGAWIAKKAAGLFGGVIKFFASLTGKQWMIIIGALLICFAQYKFYGYAKGNGIAEQAALDKPVIEQLTKERDEADRKYKSYRTGFINWIRATRAAQKLYQEEQKQIVDDLEQRLLDGQEHKDKKKKEIAREIPKLIPVDSVRNYDLPLGFIRLYDISIEGEGTYGTSNGFLSGSLPIDVEAPSGLTLAGASETIVENNLECIYRGEVIRAWQEWYPKMKAAYEKAVKVQKDTVPEPLPAPPNALLLESNGGEQSPSAELPTAPPSIASAETTYATGRQ